MPSDTSATDTPQKGNTATTPGGDHDRSTQGDGQIAAAVGDSDPLGAKIFASMVADQGREKLIQGAAKGITDASELKQFKQDANDFAARAEKANLSPAEINATYDQIGRLLTGNGASPLSAGQRTQLAEQVMHQAAHPTSISQGEYRTCNMTTVEMRTYSKYPSAAAKMVSDIALNGEYTSASGLKVAFTGTLADSREPHGQAQTNPPKNGERTYASQLFQVTGVNIHYQKLAKSDPGGFYQYEQHEAGYLPKGSAKELATNNGEYLIAYPKGERSRIASFGPNLGADDITEVANEISGKNDKGFVLETNAPGHGKETTLIDSAAKLDATLATMKDAGQLPAIIQIDDSDVLFNGYIGPHVVTIPDYDKDKKTVALDNSWNSADNYLDDKSLRMTDVYRAMTNTSGSDRDQSARAARDLADRNSNRAKGTIDTAVEWDYVRDKWVADGSIAETRQGSAYAAADRAPAASRDALKKAADKAEEKTITTVLNQMSVNAKDALAHTGPIWQKQMADGTLDEREARVAVTGMAEAISFMDGPQIEALMKQPYWETAQALLKRFPDQVAVSRLDDSRKQLMQL